LVKKLYTYIGIFIGVLLILLACNMSNGTGSDISEKLIRFHVIANSDSPEDQTLKLKVRDQILKAIGPVLEKSRSKEESKEILKNNLDLIKSIAEREIARNGQSYSVSVALGRSLFPAKMYSNITLPPGEYDALEVVIGDGGGKNWWCVMFPPLCFVDITRGITDDETEARLKEVLSEGEYNAILTNGFYDPVKKPIRAEDNVETYSAQRYDEGLPIRFKSVEVVKSLFEKVQEMFAEK